MTIDLTKNQIEELIREKDTELGEITMADEEEQAKGNDEQEDDPMGQPSADYSPGENKDKDGDVTMESSISKWDDRVDDVEVMEIDDDEDEMDSLQINYDRFPIDLPTISKPAFCTDVELKACRYLLFKIAKFATDHFVPWKKHVLEKTDRHKRSKGNEGLRHDITGKDHPIEMTTVTENGVEREEPIYKNGLYITASDQTAYEHYHNLHLRGGTQNPPDENLRRYRFSVVVNRLTETLYRLGYEMEKDGDFGIQVKNMQLCRRADGRCRHETSE